jgi:phosphomannomutase
VAARYGARVIRTAVGEANVVSAMKEHGSSVGGEGNGGIIWPRVAYVRDSVAGMGLILSLLENGKRKLSEIVSGMPSYAIVKRKVDLASKEDARPAVEKLAKAYASQRVDLQDGVRVDFEGSRSWLHVRASNTEPIMRLIAEAPDEAGAVRVLSEAERVIRG